MIDFCFQGWIRGARITLVIDVATGKDLDVRTVPDTEIVANLGNGTWAISLA
ncbi:hypothetical protein LCGC14_2409800, partial [marine sediment metagenome]